jgi:hypothetical protein
MRTKYPNKRPLCACGCGDFVIWNKEYNNRWNKFIRGHNQKDQKHSIESKKKMSIAAIGRKHSKHSKEKMRQANIGKKLSEKTKLKMSIAFTGRKHSKETKSKMSKSTKKTFQNPTILLKYCGKNHHNWKGGISYKPYCANWTKEYREYIKDRDNNECQNPDCWLTSSRSTVHHIDYIKKNCEPKNLITLCNSCNIRANTNREKWTSFYQEIIKQKYKLKEAA